MYWSILFQFVLLIVVPSLIPLCETRRKPTSSSSPAPAQVASVPKKKRTKRKKKKMEEKEFPVFVMPTESAKMKKLKEVDEDKKKKIKEGFYQEKSDVDDTLEKIESLRVEISDRTKRAQKKKI